LGLEQANQKVSQTPNQNVCICTFICRGNERYWRFLTFNNKL
jgi:hypothetical protein